MVRRDERKERRLPPQTSGTQMGKVVHAAVDIYYRGEVVAGWRKDFSTHKQAVKEMLANIPITGADFPSSLVFEIQEAEVSCSVHYYSVPTIIIKEGMNGVPY